MNIHIPFGYIIFTLCSFQVVVDLGSDSDFALGLSYVALSRVRSIKDMLLQPFTFKRFQTTPKQKVNIEIRNDFLNYMKHKRL